MSYDFSDFLKENGNNDSTTESDTTTQATSALALSPEMGESAQNILADINSAGMTLAQFVAFHAAQNARDRATQIPEFQTLDWDSSKTIEENLAPLGMGHTPRKLPSVALCPETGEIIRLRLSAMVRGDSADPHAHLGGGMVADSTYSGNRATYTVAPDSAILESIVDTIAKATANGEITSVSYTDYGAQCYLVARIATFDARSVGDPTQIDLVFTWTHDGAGALRCYVRLMRVACSNMQVFKALKLGDTIRLTHKSGTQAKYDAFMTRLDEAIADVVAEYSLNAELMAGIAVTPDQIVKLFEKITGKKLAKNNNGSISERSLVLQLCRLSQSGDGQAGISNTLYGVYNAATQHATRSVRSDNGSGLIVNRHTEQPLSVKALQVCLAFARSHYGDEFDSIIEGIQAANSARDVTPQVTALPAPETPETSDSAIVEDMGENPAKGPSERVKRAAKRKPATRK